MLQRHSACARSRHRRRPARHICPARRPRCRPILPPAISQRVAGGQRLDSLVVAACVHFRRVDAAQAYARRNVHAGPDVYPRHESVAVDHAHHVGRMTAAQCRDKVRRLRLDRRNGAAAAGGDRRDQRTGGQPGGEGHGRQQQRAAPLRHDEGSQRYEHNPILPPAGDSRKRNLKVEYKIIFEH